MLVRALPLLRVVALILAVAVVVLLGAVAWALVFGNDSDTPRTELERGMLVAEEAVKANPEDAVARVKLAAAYLENKEYTAALEQADFALRLKPEDPTPLYVIGVAKDATGDHQGAIETLNKAIDTEGQLGPFYADTWAALSRAYEHAGDPDKALEAMNEAIGLSPENALLLFARGQMYERMSKFGDALLDYSWALEYTPGFEEAQRRFDALSEAHPEALEALRERLQHESQEATSTAGTTTTSGG